jgi:hypothetical protein
MALPAKNCLLDIARISVLLLDGLRIPALSVLAGQILIRFRNIGDSPVFGVVRQFPAGA